MISHVLTLLLLTAFQSQTDPNQARKVYSKCLSTLIKADLKEKLEPAVFDTKVSGACKAEEENFRKLMVASDVARGIKRSTAEEDVSSEITDYQQSAKEEYRVYLEGTTPLPK